MNTTTQPRTFTAVPWQIENGRRGTAHTTEAHPVRYAMRKRRADNAARNFATGHWQRTGQP